MEDEISQKQATLAEHLSELRVRLLWSVLAFFCIFALSYYFVQDIYDYLVEPLAQIYQGQPGKRLIYTGLSEAFITYVKLAFYTSLFFSFPIFASQIYLFLAPGLYKKEKKILLPYLVATPILFLLGAAMAYYVVFPLAWKFFVGFEVLSGKALMPIMLEARVSEYLSLVISLVFAFGIAFQLPIILTILAKIGIVSAEDLKRKRKYAIIAILFIAALLTPPDVISQIALALPLYLLYECSIISCKIVKKA